MSDARPMRLRDFYYAKDVTGAYEWLTPRVIWYLKRNQICEADASFCEYAIDDAISFFINKTYYNGRWKDYKFKKFLKCNIRRFNLIRAVCGMSLTRPKSGCYKSFIVMVRGVCHELDKETWLAFKYTHDVYRSLGL